MRSKDDLMNIISSPQMGIATINGRNVLQFASNCYLSLADNEEIMFKVFSATKKYGISAGGSRYTSGNYELNEVLENALAKFENKEESIVFNSGYGANLGGISALCTCCDFVFSDEFNHASIIDGIKLGSGKVVVYKHCDIDDLVYKIKENSFKRGLIITDSVFSMDGDIAPIPKLIEVSHKNNCLLMIDEAHALGVLGHGSYNYFDISTDDIDIIMGTLSKSICSEGGFISSSKELINLIKRKARSFIFSTALPPSSLAAAIAALEYIQKHNEIIYKLQANIKYFIEKLHSIGIETQSKSAVVPIVISGKEKAYIASKLLFQKGINVPAIQYPAVKEGSERLRFSLVTSHTFEQLDYVVSSLHEVLNMV